MCSIIAQAYRDVYIGKDMAKSTLPAYRFFEPAMTEIRYSMKKLLENPVWIVVVFFHSFLLPGASYTHIHPKKNRDTKLPESNQAWTCAFQWDDEPNVPCSWDSAIEMGCECHTPVSMRIHCLVAVGISTNDRSLATSTYCPNKTWTQACFQQSLPVYLASRSIISNHTHMLEQSDCQLSMSLRSRDLLVFQHAINTFERSSEHLENFFATSSKTASWTCVMML